MRLPEVGEARLTDLFKFFNCVSHDLLIAKLEGNGFSYGSLKFVRSSLTGKVRRLVTCSRKPEVLGSNPSAIYAQKCKKIEN